MAWLWRGFCYRVVAGPGMAWLVRSSVWRDVPFRGLPCCGSAVACCGTSWHAVAWLCRVLSCRAVDCLGMQWRVVRGVAWRVVCGLAWLCMRLHTVASARRLAWLGLPCCGVACGFSQLGSQPYYQPRSKPSSQLSTMCLAWPAILWLVCWHG